MKKEIDYSLKNKDIVWFADCENQEDWKRAEILDLNWAYKSAAIQIVNYNGVTSTGIESLHKNKETIMKKIKSVKLAKDFRTAKDEMLQGRLLRKVGGYHFKPDAADNKYISGWKIGEYFFVNSEITDNKTGLFDIEYESESDTFTEAEIREYAKEQFRYDTFFINYLNDFFNSRKGN